MFGNVVEGLLAKPIDDYFQRIWDFLFFNIEGLIESDLRFHFGELPDESANRGENAEIIKNQGAEVPVDSFQVLDRRLDDLYKLSDPVR